MSRKAPVIDPNDVKRSLINLREYFVNAPQESTPKEIINAAGIFLSRGNTLSAEATVTLKGASTNDSGNEIDPTKHIDMVFNGIRYRIAVLK